MRIKGNAFLFLEVSPDRLGIITTRNQDVVRLESDLVGEFLVDSLKGVKSLLG